MFLLLPSPGFRPTSAAPPVPEHQHSSVSGPTRVRNGPARGPRPTERRRPDPSRGPAGTVASRPSPSGLGVAGSGVASARDPRLPEGARGPIAPGPPAEIPARPHPAGSLPRGGASRKMTCVSISQHLMARERTKMVSSLRMCVDAAFAVLLAAVLLGVYLADRRARSTGPADPGGGGDPIGRGPGPGADQAGGDPRRLRRHGQAARDPRRRLPVRGRRGEDAGRPGRLRGSTPSSSPAPRPEGPAARTAPPDSPRRSGSSSTTGGRSMPPTSVSTPWRPPSPSWSTHEAVAQGLKQDLRAEVVAAELADLIGGEMPLHFDLDGWRPAALPRRVGDGLPQGEVPDHGRRHDRRAAAREVPLRQGDRAVHVVPQREAEQRDRDQAAQAPGVLDGDGPASRRR